MANVYHTPTFALTGLGLVGLLLRYYAGWKSGELVAFIGFVLAAGGVAMAIADEVAAANEAWGWQGIYRSVRRPRRAFYRHFLGHLPQLTIALLLAYGWFRQLPPR